MSSPATGRPLPDRVLAGLPLGLAYLLLCCLYAWQATRHITPTLFTDELEFAQLSRSIAETGEAARRGVPYGSIPTLYAYVVAPAWWLDDTESAYELAKLIGVLVMSSTLFPAYFLARSLVPASWALGAAVASAAIPALAYASFLVEEPLAYPVSTLALLLVARAVLRATALRVGLAVAVCLVAPLVRSQLAILLPLLGLAFAARFWESERLRARRTDWSRADYIGLALLVIGVSVATSAFLGHQSTSWYTATGFFKQRMFDYGLRALGALVIGIGVLPFVAGFAAVLGRWRDEDERARAFALTAAAAFFTFGLYTAVKASYISTSFGTVTVERNLIYIAPLLMAGTALLLQRPGRHWLALGVSAVIALYVLVTTPYELDKYPYYDAPGLAIASLPNRLLRWDGQQIETALVLILVLSVAFMVVRSLWRGRRSAVLAVALGTFVVAWNLTAEIYAAQGQTDFSERLAENAPQPLNWLDRATGGDPALFLGNAVDDANGIHLLEFWNRSLKKVWSLDGSAPGPGYVLTPNLGAPDGTLDPDAGVRWVVAENDASVVGTKIGAPRGSLQLYRLDGPLRLISSQGGITGDGWMGATATFNQYASPGNPRGFVKILLSRVASCGPDKPGRVTVRVGSVVVGADKEPALGTVLAERRGVIHQCQALPFFIPITVPFRVEVTIDPTFSPAELDERSSDTRQLGARPEFSFVPLP